MHNDVATGLSSLARVAEFLLTSLTTTEMFKFRYFLTHGYDRYAVEIWGQRQWFSRFICHASHAIIAIATLSDSLSTRDFSNALRKRQVTTRNSDWFITPFAPVVIGRNNYYSIGFSSHMIY